MQTSSIAPNTKTLDRLLELSSDAICIINKNQEITFINNAVLTSLAYQKEELIGKAFSDIICEDDKDQLKKTVSNVFSSSNIAHHIKSKCISKQGELIDFDWSLSFDKDLNSVLIIGKKTTKNTLSQKEKIHNKVINKALINGGNHLIWSLDKNYCLTGFNDAFKKTRESEYPAKINIGISTFDTMDFSDDVINHWKSIYDKVFEGEPFVFEYNTAAIEENPKKIKWHKIVLNPIKINDEIIGLVGTSTDITELKNVANELVDRNNLIEQVMQEIPLGVAVNEIDTGKPVLINSQFTQAYNWPADSILDVEDFLNKIYPNDDDSAQRMLQKISRDIQSGDPEKMIWNNVAVRGQNNETRYVNAKNIPLLDQNLMISTVSDNTETYTNKLALESAYVEKNEILNGISDAFYTLDENFNFTFLNKHSLAIMEMEADQLIGKNLFEAFPELKSTTFYEELKKVKETNYSSKFEFYYELFDAWFDERIYKSQRGFSIFYVDISQRKNLTLRLEAAYQKQNEILESITDAFIGLDKDFCFNYVNQEAQHVFNIDKEELLGKSLKEVFPIAFKSDLYNNLKNTLSTNKPQNFQYFYTVTEQWFSINCYPSSAGLSVYFRNITKAKQAELELKKLNISLKQKNEELEQFAFVASHDLQEPLRIISSFMDLLKGHLKNQLDDTSEKYIDYAIEGSARMKQIILDLLDYSRAGADEQEITEIDCNQLVNQIQDLLEDTISTKEAVIKIDTLPTLRFNHTALRQVMMNLITNALKYVEAGVKPIIQISCIENNDHFYFSITDNGIGIKDKYYEEIFTIFKRLHNRTTYSGTGIGLAICKKIIEKYGGTISVTSKIEKGTTFSFTILKNI